ncbi:MAG: OadG-related small transporter subunit [Romboutsia sp.]
MLEGLKLMVFGMGGIFLVTGVIYLSIKVLNEIDKNK